MLIFQNMKKNILNAIQKELVWKSVDSMKDPEQSQLSTINIHFTH